MRTAKRDTAGRTALDSTARTHTHVCGAASTPLGSPRPGPLLAPPDTCICCEAKLGVWRPARCGPELRKPGCSECAAVRKEGWGGLYLRVEDGKFVLY